MCRFLVARAGHDTPAIMEHPTEAHWRPQAPSSWVLDEVRYILSLPGAEKVTVAQCLYGCEYEKPTTFLT
eukprot:656338-Pyramimonas_sp.AAC.1